jgi:hypothetical protein
MSRVVDFVLRSDAHFAVATTLLTLAVGALAVLLTPGGDR